MVIKKIDPLSDGLSSLELVRSAGSDLDVVNAARVCFGTTSVDLDERDKKLIHYLIAHHHTSPFEHNQLVFRVATPIFVARQWFRHRIGVSYNEVSGRYTEIPLEFYIPKKFRVADTTNRQGSQEAEFKNHDEIVKNYKHSLNVSGEIYQKLLSEGVCKELARGILPLSTYTHFIFTCNLVSLFHFVKLRADCHAQWEIQQYAKGMLKFARESFPISVEAWEKVNEIDLK